MSSQVRLNKFLASCGIGSRRACDDLIVAGSVEINGQPCINPGTKVDEGDHVKVDGKRVTARRHTTILINKPRGLVCTREDEFQRETIYTLLPGSLQHLHHVGRLDADSEGLLLLTNDGDLSQKLMHPSNKVEKEYLVTANQPFLPEHLDLFLTGVYTKEGKLHAKALRRESSRRISIILDQGAKRQIRVMFETLSYQVTKLVRVRIGSLWGGDLDIGRHAILDDETIQLALTNPRLTAGKWQTREMVLKQQKQKPLAETKGKSKEEYAPVRRHASPAKKRTSQASKRSSPPPPKSKRTPFSKSKRPPGRTSRPKS